MELSLEISYCGLIEPEVGRRRSEIGIYTFVALIAFTAFVALVALR